MPNLEEFPLANADYLVFAAYCALLCIVGYWVGRKEKQTSADYFLADRSLPWYVAVSYTHLTLPTIYSV